MDMKISVVTPNFNGARFLERAMRSVLDQQGPGFEVEYLIMDGGSRDGSEKIIARYADRLAATVSEPDRGPADAINKGLARATGDILCWLNADDFYYPGALQRVAAAFAARPQAAFVFGHCPIVSEDDREIRPAITRFKEAFFPVSHRFTLQSINYISQPATFFSRAAFMKAGPLRENLKAAWDYDLWLRLWPHGGGHYLRGEPLAAFRWHTGSISGRHFADQFREEWQVAAQDAGRWSLQSLLHLGVRWGIVGIYTAMAWRRRRQGGPA